jgi:Lon protease-like protein
VISTTLPSIRICLGAWGIGHNITMPSRLLPLFPLQVVVFPRTDLPLHIFEERYKEMIGEAIRDKSEFGVVLAKENGIVNVGCTVAVDRVVHAYPDGRLDILTRGQRRFDIVTLDEEKSYLRGEVNFFDDDDSSPVPADVREAALANFRDLRQIVSLRGRTEPDLADPQLSFQMAQCLPDLDLLNTLLGQRSETGRLKRLNHYLTQYIPRQRAIAHVREVAPTNGCGGRPAGL